MAYLLLIDTAGQKAKVALAQDNNILAQQEWKNGKETGTRLVTTIEKMLKQQSVSLRDIQRVAVHGGPGHYSALRTGVVAGQMLAFATGCELVEASGDSLQEMLDVAHTQPPVKQIVPKYT